MAKPKKLQLDDRTLIQRINRKLAQKANPEQVRTARGAQQREQLGRYFVIETGVSDSPKDVAWSVVDSDVDLAKLARKLGVLHPWEERKAD